MRFCPNWHAANPKYAMGGGHWTPDGDFFLFDAGILGMFSQNPAARLSAMGSGRAPKVAASVKSRTRGVDDRSDNLGWICFLEGWEDFLYSSGSMQKGELVRYEAKARELVPYLEGSQPNFVNFSGDGSSLVYVTFPEGSMWRAKSRRKRPATINQSAHAPS